MTRNNYLQIEVFRELRSASGKIRHNFRPIQPIGDRTVFYNIDSDYYTYNEIDDLKEQLAWPRTRKRENGASLSRFSLVLRVLTLLFIFLEA